MLNQFKLIQKIRKIRKILMILKIVKIEYQGIVVNSFETEVVLKNCSLFILFTT